jgi:hypothetical protein
MRLHRGSVGDSEMAPATKRLPPLLARPPDPVECLGPKDIAVRERLGGLLRHYERKAA